MIPLRNTRGGIAKTLLTLLSTGIILAVMGVAGGGYFIYTKYSENLPDVEVLRQYHPSLVTRILDSRDRLIAEYYVEKRIMTDFEDIPPLLVLATIAVEDSSFFEHHGINLEGIVRAMIANFKAGRVVQGGSSITQQVAKQVLLSSERTFERKIKEAIVSIQIDRHYTKNEILEIYLNHIYYGHGAYGVAAAAQTFFGKKLDQLTIAETAMIASLPKAPTNYSPYNNPVRAAERRAHSLRRMVVIGAITEGQRAEAEAEPFRLAGLKKPVNKTPWFSEYIRRYLEGKYGARSLYSSGMIVHTTLDLPLQEHAVAAVRRGIETNDRRLGYRGPLKHFDLDTDDRPDWATINQNLSSEERYRPGARLTAMVTRVEKSGAEVTFGERSGSLRLADMAWAHPVNLKKNARWIAKMRDARDILKPGDLILVQVKEKQKPGLAPLAVSLRQEPNQQGALLCMDPRTGYVRAMVGGYDAAVSKFNRATQARRQPGSSFKPLIYTAAFDFGLTAASIIIDSPIIYDKALTPFKGWTPTNFEQKFFGPTTVREALTHSRNVVTIKVLEKIGITFAAEFAIQRFGIKSPIDRNLSMALGASPMTMLEMVTAYATLANGGTRPRPIFVTSIEDSDGNVIERNEPTGFPVFPPSLAYLTTNVMAGVVQNGTGRKVAAAIKRPIAGKTGTTNNNIDAWFNGFTPDLVTSVWIGRDNNTPLGYKETGSRAAIPTWIDFMKVALAGTPVNDFTPTDEIVFVRIDKKSGLLTRATGPDTLFEAFLDGTQPSRFVTSRSDRTETTRPSATNL